MLKTDFYSTTLTAPLEADERYLPLSQEADARLRTVLDEGDYTYLTLDDFKMGKEVIRVTNTCSTLLVDRAQDGTTARKFPKGSCVSFQVTPAVVKELICTHDCCAGDCPCEDVEAAGYSFPKGSINLPWQGSVVFTGDTPMQIGVTNMPAWMTASVGANYVVCSGTPTGVGTFVISVAATNCSGAVAIQQCELIIE